MTDYRHGPHSVFEIHLHLVWVTKYRKPVLTGAVGSRVRDLIREICGASDVLIIKGHVSKDHVHLLVSIPPQVTISRLVQRLKGKSAYKTWRRWKGRIGSTRCSPRWYGPNGSCTSSGRLAAVLRPC